MAGVNRVRLVSHLTILLRYKVIRSGRDSSVGTVKVRGSNPDVCEVFLIRPDGPQALSILLSLDTWV
jgi:hypothetical protein